MKLKDLKQGMVCELRNGYEIIILSNNKYVFDTAVNDVYQLSKDYNDNLINIDSNDPDIDYDIIKVTFGNEVIYERPESNLFFEPEKGETYYFINEGGVWSLVNDSDYDDAIIKTNIVFKTKEEAEKELLRRQAKIRVIKEIARLNDGWDVKEHWGNNLIEKYLIAYYHIAYYHETSKLTVSSAFNFKTLDNNLYLKTRELAEQLIETHSDDLKLMLEVE